MCIYIYEPAVACKVERKQAEKQRGGTWKDGKGAPAAANPRSEVLIDVPSTPFFLGMPQDSHSSGMDSLPRLLRFLSGFQSAALPQESSVPFLLDADLRPPTCCHSEQSPSANSLHGFGKYLLKRALCPGPGLSTRHVWNSD